MSVPSALLVNIYVSSATRALLAPIRAAAASHLVHEHVDEPYRRTSFHLTQRVEAPLTAGAGTLASVGVATDDALVNAVLAVANAAFDSIGSTAAQSSATAAATATAAAAASTPVSAADHCFELAEGAHPALGVVDHIAVFPLGGASRGQAAAAAIEIGRRIGNECAVPVLCYGWCVLQFRG